MQFMSVNRVIPVIFSQYFKISQTYRKKAETKQSDECFHDYWLEGRSKSNDDF